MSARPKIEASNLPPVAEGTLALSSLFLNLLASRQIQLTFVGVIVRLLPPLTERPDQHRRTPVSLSERRREQFSRPDFAANRQP